MKILSFLKDHPWIPWIIGLALFFVLQKSPKAPGNIVTVLHDTTIIHHDTTILSERIITKSIYPDSIPVKYTPDSSYNKLRAQYEDLVRNHITQNIYSDTTKVDSIGYIARVDTVQENKLRGSKLAWSLKEREITNTITIREPYKPVNQLYYGGELGWGTGAGSNALNSASVGIMVKNKKDNVLKISGGYIIPLKSPEIKIGYYHKLSLKSN